jgi:hypothetical protein
MKVWILIATTGRYDSECKTPLHVYGNEETANHEAKMLEQMAEKLCLLHKRAMELLTAWEIINPKPETLYIAGVTPEKNRQDIKAWYNRRQAETFRLCETTGHTNLHKIISAHFPNGFGISFDETDFDFSLSESELTLSADELKLLMGSDRA